MDLSEDRLRDDDTVYDGHGMPSLCPACLSARLFVPCCIDPFYWLSKRLDWPGSSGAPRSFNSLAVPDAHCNPPFRSTVESVVGL